ncbi:MULTISPECIES: MocR-like transcription factor YczR [Streptomyces]|uniref:MocR-like transcription factor YczR n=1 Tax=Streptomyces TaxID=1883 RepID=UPI0016742820|nr:MULTISPECIES: PLP-dependent aminotransferase family protein [Streptomyces]MBK3525785.1 PLP-dependent aminotransferase family protein [Streptomyces sp. MBT70]GGS13696.1 GntR family transcriptional regulator [Streptomyces eurythermus]
MSADQTGRLLGDWLEDGPAYLALAKAFRALITDGRLPAGTRIPSERVLAAQCRIGRNTVTAAYSLLRTEGYLEGHRGAGTFTALPPGHQRVRTAPQDARRFPENRIDLAVAQVPAPEPLLAEAVRDAACHVGKYTDGPVHDRVGLRELRQAIADRYTRRGLPTSADEIMVTTGAYQGWGLLLRLTAQRFDPVLVDAPTYPDAVQAIRSIAGRPLPVGLGPEGWDPELLVSACRQARPVLAYLMPDHHNPTGHVMPDEVREAVAAGARRSGTLLVVDETLSELTLEGPAPRPMAAFASRGQVVTIGSLSKIFWSGLNLGWIRATPSLISRLAALRGPGDAGNSVVNQLIARRLFDDYDAVLRERRLTLSARRDHLVGALRRHLPEWTFSPPRGGLCLWVDLGERVSSRLACAAEGLGVDILTGSRFAVEGTLDNRLRLPFVQPPDVLSEGVERLAAAYAAVRGHRSRPTAHALLAA